MADVFLSYNREDQPRARQVADALEAEGFSIWWDAALRAGETYDEVTEKNLRQAAAVVVLWSKRSVNSKWVRAEATVGERSSTLVPALLEECDRPVRFELVQTADLMRWRGDRADPNWRAFIQDIRAAVTRHAGAQGAATAAARPPAGAAEIETAFWNSIQESRDPSDFDAYLARYPNGYFASLAQNRLGALIRQPASRGAATAQTAHAAQSAAARPAPPRPAQAAHSAAQSAAPVAAQQKRAPAPLPAKKSANGLLIGVAAIALAGAGVAAFFILSKPKPVETVEAAAPLTPPPPDPARDAAPTEAPYTDKLAADVYADSGEDAAPADESGDGALVTAAAEPPAVAAAPAAEPEPAVGGPFRDCPTCPQMVPISGGAFMMGSPDDEPGRNAYEGPQHEVTAPAFSIGAYEVTNLEWKACVEDGACPAKRAGDDAFPVLGVSWREATGYAAWLTKKTGRAYRLPSEAEWEFAARGGTTTAYWWGDRFERDKAGTALGAVGGSGPNGFGLYDVSGNAREWTADCYVNNFRTAPTDGSAASSGDCSRRVIRGGAWSSAPADRRVANRSRIEIDGKPGYMGFRVAAGAP